MKTNFFVDFDRPLREKLRPDLTDVERARLWGYIEAVTDFAIWKEGKQTIGALDTPPNEAILRRARELGLLRKEE